MGVPEFVRVDAGHALPAVDRQVFPANAELAASCVLLDDRCVHPTWTEEALTVTLSPKRGEPTDAPALALAGTFANEHLNLAMRASDARERRPILEAIVGSAIAGAAGPVPRPTTPRADLEST